MQFRDDQDVPRNRRSLNVPKMQDKRLYTDVREFWCRKCRDRDIPANQCECDAVYPAYVSPIKRFKQKLAALNHPLCKDSYSMKRTKALNLTVSHLETHGSDSVMAYTILEEFETCIRTAVDKNQLERAEAREQNDAVHRNEEKINRWILYIGSVFIACCGLLILFGK